MPGDMSGIISTSSYQSFPNFNNFPCSRSVAGRLDNTWKNFAAGLDERTTVLSLSVLFHQKAENVRKQNLHFSF